MSLFTLQVGKDRDSLCVDSFDVSMYWKQDASRESPNGSIQSPEITSKLSFTDDESKDNVKRLTEKLSAALVNVSAKEDLVKQHARVAEEAVAGKHFCTFGGICFSSLLYLL